MGQRRDDLSTGLRSFVADDYAIIYSIGVDEVVLILYVFHGSREKDVFFRE